MTLKEIRKQNELTQKDAAILIGVPYRTYVRYEEKEPINNSYKYEKMILDLNDKLRIDETHGVYHLEKIKELLLPILRKHNISYCYLFGSYARNEAKPTSDIDLLVDTDMTGIRFLGLVEEIREKLCKKIDLLRLKDLEASNPIILEILKEGIKIDDPKNRFKNPESDARKD